MSELRHQSKAEFAAIFGVSDPTISRYSKQPDFPPPNDRKQYEVLAVVRWYLMRKAPKQLRLVEPSTVSEPEPSLFDAPPSDDFQGRHTRAKALKEELGLLERTSSVVSVHDLEAAFSAIQKHLTAAGEALTKKYGDGAAEILEGALNQAEAVLTEAIAND